jgi:hypothetical protein
MSPEHRNVTSPNSAVLVGTRTDTSLPPADSGIGEDRLTAVHPFPVYVLLHISFLPHRRRREKTPELGGRRKVQLVEVDSAVA